MLFHITQTHTPELCPKGEGGSSVLYNPKAEGVKFLAMYGAFPEHVIYYIVEAETFEAVEAVLEFVARSLDRGRCEMGFSPRERSRKRS